MKLKNHNVLVFSSIIICIALLSINLTSKSSIKTENRSSRIIIKSTEEYTADSRIAADNEVTRKTVPIKHDSPALSTHKLPAADANTPILVTPLY